MSPRDFPVAPPRVPVLLLPAIACVVALGVLAGVLVAAHASRNEWLRASPAFGVVMLVLPLLAWRISRRSVRLDEAGLHVHRLPWSRAISLDELDLGRAQVLDLSRHPDLQPTIKLIGTRLPGYRSGHFRLRHGARASLAITDPGRVLVLPRRDGNFVMLSLESPGALLEALQRAAARAGDLRGAGR
jgi:hypothetical protein